MNFPPFYAIMNNMNIIGLRKRKPNGRAALHKAAQL